MELTARLGIEPFATLPYIRTPGEVRRKRMIVAGVLALIAVAIPAILFAIQTYWMPLDMLFAMILAKVGLGSGVPAPVSISVQPSASRSSHTLTWLRRKGSGSRAQRMPGAIWTSSTSPSPSRRS